METTESLAQSSLSSPPECLGREEKCPLCGHDNRCRVTEPQLYKGPCWCHEIIVPHHMLSRLAADSSKPVCLCRPCLETVARISRELEDTDAALAEVRKVVADRVACEAEKDFYLDENGYTVFTSAYHLRRGTCCDNGCRHCPY